MKKITDETYRLPLVTAVSSIEEVQHSANKPLLITGIDRESGEKDEYYVKLNAAERMGYTVPRCKELIAAFMAMELELHVVQPAIIDISREFADTTLDKPYYKTVEKSIGYNVASKNVRHMQSLTRNQPLSKKQQEGAFKIFAFDVLIQNVDRSFVEGKPNLITDGEQLVMLDHELAFSFHETLPFLKSKTPWLTNTDDFKWIKNHCLFKHIEHQKVDYISFLDSLHIFDAHFWEQVNNFVPSEWKSDIIDSIKNHVDSMIQNKKVFAQSLNQLL